MDRLRVRFEQRRGHWLVVEGEPALTGDDCDSFRLRMLQTCEVPGLLRPEAEDIDGKLALRFPLNGSRMLSQTMRAEKWSIEDLLTALCRLAEVLDDCRLYVLEEDRIVLDDDRIFVGEGWNDLRFLYLPLREGLQLPAPGLRELIVRWIMYVAEPDGPIIQRLLRLSASPGFRPADLRTFARQTLSDKIGTGAREWAASREADEAERRNRPASAAPVPAAAAPAAMPSLQPEESPKATAASAPGSWRWFQPPSSEAQALSGLLGEQSVPDSDWNRGEGEIAEGRNDNSRLPVLLACGSAGAIALSWRWGYAAFPGRGGLLLSASLTLAFAGGALAIWLFALRKRAPGGASGPPPERSGAADPRPSDGEGRSTPVDWLPERPVSDVRSQGGSSSDQLPHGGTFSGHRAHGWSTSGQPMHGKPILDPRTRESFVPQDQRLGREEALRQPPDPSIPRRMDRQVEPNVQGDGAGMMSFPEDRTQLLSAEQRSPAAVVFGLRWESQPNAPVVPLVGPSFVIGRSRDASAHVDETVGVSRAHLELLQGSEGWLAKDLGSRNGTKLNGQPMVPYETYPLRPEDLLELAGSRYRFKSSAEVDTRL
jgi:hypothetical protein